MGQRFGEIRQSYGLERRLLMSSRWLVVASSLILTLAGALAALGAAQTQPAKPKDGPLGMKFVRLPKATFYMGWDGVTRGKKTEIKEDFEIAIHTVTQGQWQALMGDNPSCFSRDGKLKDKVKDIPDQDLKQFPIEHVSWTDAQEFIKKLNEKETGRGYLYRLPSEAEWEFACRGGAISEEECSYHYYVAKPTNDLSSEQANFNGDFPDGNASKGKYLGRPTKVGSYAPNKLGLYDMHGNVWQMCADLYDPKGVDRVIRGGSWYDDFHGCRAAARDSIEPTSPFLLLGIRLARIPVR
jgi:formylglycine-generating enzyme required for sulfatase activity